MSQSSDGVGRSRDSYGIADDRGVTSSNLHASVFASGRFISQCPKLKQDDIIICNVDLIEGWFEISINETEFSYRFDVPILPHTEYVFAMTFANDHCARILTDPGSAELHHFEGLGALNRDHSDMYIAFKKVSNCIKSALL